EVSRGAQFRGAGPAAGQREPGIAETRGSRTRPPLASDRSRQGPCGRGCAASAVSCKRMKEDLTELEARLEHTFRQPQLLQRALTHSSHAHEESKAAGLESAAENLDNEQFEFLGDAVLGLVASQLLFERFPGFHEGRLSKLKAHLVSARHLVSVAT